MGEVIGNLTTYFSRMSVHVLGESYVESSEE